MAEALSPQTGELSSQGDPHINGALNPDVTLVSENPSQIIDPISGLIPTDPIARRVASLTDSQLDEIEAQTDGSNIIQLQSPRSSRGMAAGASLAAGVAAFTTAAIVENVNPDSAKASGDRMMATAAGGGNICTPEFLAEYHEVIVKGGPSEVPVGGEPTSNSSGEIAQAAGADTAAIQDPEPASENQGENIIVRFTDQNGVAMEVSIEPCEPPMEEDICEDPQVKKFFRDFPNFADYDGISGNDEKVKVYYKNPDGTFQLIEIDPCPPVSGPEAKWDYKTIDEAQEAWRSKKIKIPEFRRFKHEGGARLIEFNTINSFRDPDHPENPMHFYNGVLLGSKIVDDQVVISIGFQSGDGDRYTAAFKIGTDLKGVAGLAKGEDGLQAPNLAPNLTNAKDIFGRIKGKGGMPMYLITYGRIQNGTPPKIKAALKRQLDEEHDLFRFVWDSRENKHNFKNAPDSVNADMDTVDPNDLPMVLFLFSKDAI